MFCHKCGAKLPENAVFCHACGTKTVQISDVENITNEIENIKEIPKSSYNEAGLLREHDSVITRQTSAQPEDVLHETLANESYQIVQEPIQSTDLYAESISPYYRGEFYKLASGEKPKFNWAALFLNG